MSDSIYLYVGISEQFSFHFTSVAAFAAEVLQPFPRHSLLPLPIPPDGAMSPTLVQRDVRSLGKGNICEGQILLFAAFLGGLWQSCQGGERLILKTCPAVSSMKFNLSPAEKEELSQPWLDFFKWIEML